MINSIFSDTGFISLYLLAIPAVLIFVMYSRLGDIKNELNTLKQQMAILLKNQEKATSHETKPVESPKVIPAQAAPPQPEKQKAQPSFDHSKYMPQPETSLNKAPEKIVTETVIPRHDDKPIVKSVETPINKPVIKPIPKPQPPAPLVVHKPKKQINYEKFIGENLFGKIGILIFVVGIGLFVKYAIDQNWINEIWRTVLGFVVGSALLTTAGKLQKKYRTFSSLLAGGAFGIFYLTVAIAYHYYQLFSQTGAFFTLIGITILMPILAILYDRRELAIISLVGGFIAPFIVSGDNSSYLVLFTYLTILNVGMFGLSIYKKWSELPILSFVFTYLIMLFYLISHYSYSNAATGETRGLLLFATLFYFIFLLPVLSILQSKGKSMSRVLLTVIIANNFIYLGAGAFLLKYAALPFKAEGLLSLFIAIVNLALVLWLRKSKQDYKFLIYAMLGLVLTFVSITVPIQLDGNYITLFWATETVLLLWLYIKSRIWVYEYASLAMIVLTGISYLMDLYIFLDSGYVPDETLFINSNFATSLFTGLAAGAFALLAARFRKVLESARILRYSPWNALMLILSAAIIYYTFIREFQMHLNSTTAEQLTTLFTSCYLLLLCCAFTKRFSIKKFSLIYQAGIGINALVFVIYIWRYQADYTSVQYIILTWLTLAALLTNIYYVARQYYRTIGLNPQFTTYLCVMSTLIWLTVVRMFLCQLGYYDSFSSPFSISMSIAGFVQMWLGMCLHQKILRMISLGTLGIVLLKLVLIDLWAMPTVGKIIVFIMLGVILLILSFLYQKLRNVLFKNDENETN